MNPIEALKMHGVGVGKKLVGDATSADVRAGKTFSNAQGNDKQGTMPVRSLVAQTITPGVNNITKQAGIYDGDITIQGDPNLVAANIKSGISIFGVAGNNNGKRWASGSVAGDAQGKITVTGLAFQPAYIIIEGYSSSDSYYHRKTYKANTLLAGLNDIAVRRTAASPTVSVQSSSWTITSSGFSTALYSSLAGQQISWEAFE